MSSDNSANRVQRKKTALRISKLTFVPSSDRDRRLGMVLDLLLSPRSEADHPESHRVSPPGNKKPRNEADGALDEM